MGHDKTDKVRRAKSQFEGGNAVTEFTAENRVAHWRATKTLMFIHLSIWLFFSYIIHWFAVPLFEVRFLHFPVNYYMGAQGSLIVFVVQLFLFVKQQDKIDQKYGVAED